LGLERKSVLEFAELEVFEWEQILGHHWYWRYFNLPHNHFRSIRIHIL